MEVFYSIFFGFLAGALLNLMPCVLPIVFLKINTFVHSSGKNEAKLVAISTIIGILSFVFVVALVFISFEGLNWGFWLQSPNFIAVLLFLLCFFFLVLMGKLRIGVPGILGKINIKSKLGQGFVSGFFIVVFSLSCTGPVIGSAVSLALSSGKAYVVLLTLISMGLGLCLPYFFLIFGRVPSILKKKNNLQKYSKIVHFISFLALALTVCFLLFILESQTNLKMAFLVGVFLIISLIIVYLIRNKRFLKIAMLGFIIIAAFLPSINFNKPELQEKKLSYTPFNEQKLKEFVLGGATVIVNFEAAWCATCKVNNAMGFEQKEVIDYILKNNIIYMKADLTLKNNELEAFMNKHGGHGVPFYIVFSPKYKEGKTLPLLLTSSVLINNLEEIK